VDQSIIGGLVVEIGDKFVDFSIATKVKKLDALLREPI
jgi:F0F1-type ATP synthase delta subunit